MFGTTKLATAAVAGVLSLSVTGAAAFAAFQPTATAAIVAATDTGATAVAAAEKDRPKDGIKTILDRLVASGTITQAQEDAILKALKDAAGQHKDRRGAELLKRALGELMEVSVSYIGLPKEAVMGQLKAGKSLGEIANTQPGKSREGLISYDVAQVTAQIDKALAEGKITREQAERLKADLAPHVTKFVDHTFERKPAPAKERKGEKRETKPTPTPTAKPTT